MDPAHCQLKLLASGKRGLEVDSVIPADHPLIEFKGKVMLQQQYLQENDITKRSVNVPIMRARCVLACAVIL